MGLFARTKTPKQRTDEEARHFILIHPSLQKGRRAEDSTETEVAPFAAEDQVRGSQTLRPLLQTSRLR